MCIVWPFSKFDAHSWHEHQHPSKIIETAHLYLNIGIQIAEHGRTGTYINEDYKDASSFKLCFLLNIVEI